MILCGYFIIPFCLAGLLPSHTNLARLDVGDTAKKKSAISFFINKGTNFPPTLSPNGCDGSITLALLGGLYTAQRKGPRGIAAQANHYEFITTLLEHIIVFKMSFFFNDCVIWCSGEFLPELQPQLDNNRDCCLPNGETNDVKGLPDGVW